MPEDRSQELYSIGYDERQEGWFVAIAGEPRLPLDRDTLAQLVSLYNEIHRGNALALLERRALLELGQERRDLEETVHTLYDYIDTEADAPPQAAPAWRAWLARLGGPIRCWIERSRTA